MDLQEKEYSEDLPDSVIDPAQAARLRYTYRNLIVKGRKKLPLKVAKGIVGPDCAYHLYKL